MNLKADTFKVWEPKIIGIVLSFPVGCSTETDRPLCRFDDPCAPPVLVGGRSRGGAEVRGRRCLAIPSREVATYQGKCSPRHLVPVKLVTAKNSRQPELGDTGYALK